VPIDVRPIRADELVDFVEAISTGFLDRPNVQGIADEVGRHWDLARASAAVEDGRIVGTFRSWANRLTVPGPAEVAAASVTAVTVAPTHRRRGILGRLAGAQHAAARERGEVVSILFASEFPIYGRFGYGPAVTTTAWTIDTRATRLVPGAPDDGRVELAPATDATRDTARAVFDADRVRQPGEVWRRDITWQDDFGLSNDIWGHRWKGFVALHRDVSGAVDGYARYHAEEKWEDRQPRAQLIVDDFHALTSAAERALWVFLFDIDLVATIRVERRSPADRLPWMLTNLRAAVPTDVGDGLWLKLLDIPVALEARRYEQSGSLVVELIDPHGLDPRGDRIERRTRVALDATPDGARAVATDRPADVTIHAAALGAAYLGGTRLSHAAIYHGWDESRPGALRDLEALLATREMPWCSSFF
jgi:predicted acetyltransferase